MEKSAKLNEVESSVNTDANADAVKNTAATPADSVQNKANANSILKKMKQLVSASKLIEVGAHIGLNPRKWNPKMSPYIYAKRSNNLVIDVLKSLIYLNKAYSFIQELTKNGGRILIVGTNGKLIKDLIKDEAKRGQCYYITQRWLGGTLTNFKNISKSIKKLNDNIQLQKTGEIDKYTKKEQININKETEKLSKFYGGIRTMRKLPNAIIVLDPDHDKNAVAEARKLNIPVIALANTNADPNLIDYIIPINNHSIRSIALILGVLMDATCEVRNEPVKFVGKSDEEIVLPETQSKRRFNGEPMQKASVNHENKFSSKRNVTEETK
ncbi:MAG: 30S ribosomal protein S2 [Candidatus Ureaplasma intestinipullorum]|uniref:Small ribosomal subunit protein uS2 n=1 Tax=Candidatus Ureaplasma intestinipullorum TaxID=2838770 RepID=A0A9E2NXH4_9BACT|nr:30S ribosomal protein S2 [Candidatus Ureaplasma intestinipullorum]